MMVRLVLSFCFLLMSVDVFSQSPGGVGTGNLRGWFDANSGVTLTSRAVSSWTDLSAVGNATQSTSGERPTQTTSAINYNTALTFDGTDDNLELVDRMASTVTAISAYAVAKQTATTRDTWGSVFNGQVNGPAWTGGGFGIVALNSGSTNHGFYVRDYNTKGVSFAVSNGAPILMSGTWNGTSANNVQAFKNGTSAGTTAYTSGSVGDAGSSWIGSGNGASNNYCFYGDIAELIIFNTGLSTANNNKVMSYLAIKYGITMAIDYVNSSATTVYSTTSSYTNNIIGIGRDDGSGLTQKQSKNVDDTVRVYLSSIASSNAANTGSFTANLSHVMVGADNGKMCAAGSTSTEIPSGFGIVKRLNREWKITNTNFSQTFSMDFKLNACAMTGSVSVSDLRLLIDDDGNFAAGTTTSIANGAAGITMSYSSPVITVSGISNSLIASGATKYITIASVSNITPLPVELIDFTGHSEGSHHVISWKSASENNFKHYELERSEDGLAFRKITTINPTGHPAGLNAYTYLDADFYEPLTYYRLKMVDLDDTYEYSSVISVDVEKKQLDNVVVIYPNPISKELFIKLTNTALTQAEITISNLFGQTIHVQNVDLTERKENIYVNTSSFPVGTYMLTINDGKGFFMSHKILIAR